MSCLFPLIGELSCGAVDRPRTRSADPAPNCRAKVAESAIGKLGLDAGAFHV
jgi:hypothetical protein